MIATFLNSEYATFIYFTYHLPSILTMQPQAPRYVVGTLTQPRTIVQYRVQAATCVNCAQTELENRRLVHEVAQLQAQVQVLSRQTDQLVAMLREGVAQLSFLESENAVSRGHRRFGWLHGMGGVWDAVNGNTKD